MKLREAALRCLSGRLAQQCRACTCLCSHTADDDARCNIPFGQPSGNSGTSLCSVTVSELRPAVSACMKCMASGGHAADACNAVLLALTRPALLLMEQQQGTQGMQAVAAAHLQLPQRHRVL